MSSCEVNFRLVKFQSADWRRFSRLCRRTLGKACYCVCWVCQGRHAWTQLWISWLGHRGREQSGRLLARKLSLCDYKPPLIQALFFCGVAGERLMGWKKTLAQRYGSRSPRLRLPAGAQCATADFSFIGSHFCNRSTHHCVHSLVK